MNQRTLVCACALSTGALWTCTPTAAEERAIEEIVVIAHPLSGEGLAQASTVLEGEALARELGTTLGETLVRQPGIHSASFGQAVGRPVIHGLGGARVRVMEDRADAMDVSVTSADHATTIEPFIADRIEVLKGPSTLLYGNGAIGGVVDVHTGRIPHDVPEQPALRAELRGADNADQLTTAASGEIGAGNFALHLDGFYRDADDYDIPGFAESAALRAQEEEEGGEDGEEEVFGTLPGSALENRGGAVGASYVGDRGFAGIAVSLFDADYGLPGGHAHEEEGSGVEEGNVTLELEQTRIDFEAGIDGPLEGLESINVRLGYNDYAHSEIEPSGDPGTVFDNEALDGRVEFSHEVIAGFRGVAGFQYAHRDFSAEGEEAFVPPVITGNLGAFWVGERSFEAFDLETGLRYEHVAHDADGFSEESFDLFAASIGLVVPVAESWQLGAALDYSARAPAAEELYSNGAHLATASFEIGDPGLDDESALNASASLTFSGERASIGFTAYYTAFDEFIYQNPTGAAEDGLPVQQWTQADATFYGVDVEASYTLLYFDGGKLDLNGAYDFVRARLDRGDDRDLPRIPPQRATVGASVDWRALTLALDYTYADEQHRIAANELSTESYEDLRAYLGARLPAGDRFVEVFVQGRNLTDDEQRYHTSFVKEFAPQPGRTIEAGIRAML